MGQYKNIPVHYCVTGKKALCGSKSLKLCVNREYVTCDVCNEILEKQTEETQEKRVEN